MKIENLEKSQGLSYELTDIIKDIALLENSHQGFIQVSRFKNAELFEYCRLTLLMEYRKDYEEIVKKIEEL